MVEWLRADWPAPEGVVAGTSLRSGGVSAAPWNSLNLGGHVGDRANAVRENRARFKAQCGFPANPRWLRQVHGTGVAMLPMEADLPAADAAVTRRAGIVCVVLTADCLPVVLANAAGTAVGIAHAGWRGLCSGVLEATIAAFGEQPGDLLAWLGPAISPSAFEVGDEVRAAFIEAMADAEDCFEENPRGRWQADLYALARQRLAHAGVERVHGGDRCTFRESQSFFSYRRDGRCGRMATFVYRR